MILPLYAEGSRCDWADWVNFAKHDEQTGKWDDRERFQEAFFEAAGAQPQSLAQTRLYALVARLCLAKAYSHHSPWDGASDLRSCRSF